MSYGKTIRRTNKYQLRSLNAALLALLCLPQINGRKHFDSEKVVRNQNWTNQTGETPIPIIITNNCPETIWPGIGTQNGEGPGTGGFELHPTFSVQLYVSPTWQGRVWGRTNCSFNPMGTGPSNLNGVNGNGAACSTGDCFGVMDCKFSVSSPDLQVYREREKETACLTAFHRAKSQQHSPSSTSSADTRVNRHSTTSPSWTATICLWASCTYPGTTPPGSHPT